MSQHRTVPTVAVGPFTVAALSQDRLIDHIVDLHGIGRPAVACHLHVGALNHRDDSEFVDAMTAADVVYADGAATVVVGRAAGAKGLERAGLTDIGHDILDRLGARLGRPVRTALLGGPDGLAARAGDELAKTHPVDIVFVTHGFHDAASWSDHLVDLAAAKPDVVFVGLGMPREAMWAQEHFAELPDALILAAGGFFGHVCGDEQRAPAWAQRAGLEWVWRVAQDPQKGKRYAQGAVTTAALAAKAVADKDSRTDTPSGSVTSASLNPNRPETPAMRSSSLPSQSGPSARPGADSTSSRPGVPEAVTVVVATRDRPEMLRTALASIRASTVSTVVETIVVFDQSEPDHSLESNDPLRPVRVNTNSRKQGLAGARNTGTLLADSPWLAFLDDDDEWMPTKLAAQFEALERSPEARMATCGVAIRFRDKDHVRVPNPELLTFDGFLDDRMTEVHPSSFVLDRQWFIDDVGLVDEGLPGSYVEDYDVLLRASRLAPIATTPGALIRVWWHPSTFFRDRWTMIDEALDYLIAKYPEFERTPSGLARIRGQQAFARAAAGDRSRALQAIRQTIALRPTEPRAWIALGVAAGFPAQTVLNTLHRFGRGL